MSFNMVFGSASDGFSWQRNCLCLLLFLFLEIAGGGRSSAYSVIIPGVSPEVSECGR